MIKYNNKFEDLVSLIFNIIALILLILSSVFIILKATDSLPLSWNQVIIPLAIFAGLKFGESIYRIIQYTTIVVQEKRNKK